MHIIRYQLKKLIKYRGCVTPVQLINLKETIENDVDLLDGYDEIPEEWQEKIKTALEDGHVADEAWRGVMQSTRTIEDLPD